MMYLALTYDHRLLDGREAVTFLVKVGSFSPSRPHSRRPTNLLPDQGVHRGPAAHAARVIGFTPGPQLVDHYLSCLELYVAPFVDYRLKYNCHIQGRII